MAKSKANFTSRGMQPGDTVGPFVLIEKTRRPYKRYYTYWWRLRCSECGRERETAAGNLKRYVDWTKCRCVSPTAIHGFDKLVEYRIWRGMLNRCYKPTEQAYRFYGAIGRYVCKRWRESFPDFYADMGTRPSAEYSIDRIDTLKSYTCGKCAECVEKGAPANCRWATIDEQHRNAKNNLWFTHNGETKILKDWCREFGLTYRVVHRRIYDHGWSFEEATSTPIVTPKGPITFRGETLTEKDWADRLGLTRNAISQRLKHGWSIERALTTPRQGSASHQESS